MSDKPLHIVYLFTTFPKASETFLQREVEAIVAQGHRLTVYSFFGGGGDFNGLEVRKFSMWYLLQLGWVIPWVAFSRWDVFGVILRGLFTRKAPSWLNFWENMLGAGFAGIFFSDIQRLKPDLIHAAWGGAPATAAWILRRLGGYRFSAAAHAYDIYEHGGDWWLDEKLVEAEFIHTSTEMGRNSLVERGQDATKIHVVRRGMMNFPSCRELRQDRSTLRVICIARLVAKKGFDHQLRIYAELKANGVSFEGRIVGEGPERSHIEQQIESLGLGGSVTLLGQLNQSDVLSQLRWADVLLHTGIVAKTGDRDGLPNVIPEAMITGVLVFTSPHAATTEAITDGKTGRVLPVEESERWAKAIESVRDNDPSLESIRRAARQWAEDNYNGEKNARKLSELFVEAARG
ncbi:glycosyltransferase [Opitutaceae bacterium]|nr:glycosyltransferase [Opitutaceae bacterium]